MGSKANCAMLEQKLWDIAWELFANSCFVWWRGPKFKVVSLIKTSRSITKSSAGSIDLHDEIVEVAMSNQAAAQN